MISHLPVYLAKFSWARRVALLLLCVAFFGGCSKTEKLPTHPRLSVSEAQKHLSDQAHRLRTVSAEGTITLTKADNESIRFDGALVMQPPDRARLRAWKFGQAIFDLTLNDGALWLVSPSDSSHREEIRQAGASAGELARTFSSLLGAYFDATDLKGMEQGETLRFSQDRPDGTVLVCEVDRRTLTPRRYILMDSDGQARFTLTMADYVLVNDLPWAQRIMADSEAGRVQVDLRNVEINGELAPGAFVPPKRAEKLGASAK